MKIITTYFVFTLMSIYASAQCEVIKELHFPYNQGLEMSLSGKITYYDAYNFPVKSMSKTTHYKVLDNEVTKKGNQSTFLINQIVDKDTAVRNLKSPLMLDNKGMWWASGNEKVTQAILLPLQQNKSWTTYFDNEKNKMNCFTTDSLMTLYFGKVKTFGVSYEISKGKDERFEYYEESKEWYNDIVGKVATAYRSFGIERETGRVFVFHTEHQLLDYTNLPEEKLQEAQKICQ